MLHFHFNNFSGSKKCKRVVVIRKFTNDKKEKHELANFRQGTVIKYDSCIVAMHGYKTKNKCTSWESTKKIKGWNSQAVRKSKESTVNTIRISIKTASESVNRICIKKNG